MNNLNWIPWEISFVLMIISILTFARTGKKETKEDLQKEESKFDNIREGLLKANLKLDTVCNTTTETRADIKSMTKDLIAIDRRLTIVENDMKTVFNNIDELKGKVNE